MNISIARLASVGSLVALVAAAFGNTVIGLEGLELVAAGLALHVGGDTLEALVSE